MATPDQIRRRGRWSLVVGTLAAAAVLAAVAFAGHTVNPTSLTFNATEGGANPASQTFTFSGPATCTGGTITDNGPWLTLNKSTIADDDAATGGVQTTVTASVNITGLMAGGSPYPATITINPTDTQPGPDEPCDSNLTVAVTLNLSPGDSTAPDDAAVVIDDNAAWTNDSSGDVSVDISAHDAVGVSRYRLATSQAGLGSAADVAVSPAEVNFARSNLSFTLSAGEGASKEVWARFCDAANNCTDASDSIGWDKTAPTITDAGVQSGTVGLNGWFTSAVVNRFQVSEGLSGLDAACQAAFPGGNHDVSSGVAQGASVTVNSGACTDVAGNTNAGISSAAFKIDSVAPDVVLNAAANSCSLSGNNGWCRGEQTVGFTASDGTSGLAPDGAATRDFTKSTTTNGASVNIASGAVSDMAGNSNAGISAGPFKIDSVAPIVACPSPGPAFVLNQPNAQVSATVSDETSQPVNATELGNADTTSPGPKTITIAGEDNAGNSDSDDCAYTVGFNFAGLFAPIDRPNTMNVSKAGQAIPLKWRLTDYFGSPVTNLASVKVTVASIACSYGAGTTDEVEEYAAGASGLQNLGDGYYQFNWKTPTSYAGSCKQLNLDLGEGVVRTNLALISFKK